MAIFDKKPETFFNRIYWSSLKNQSFERLWSLTKNWFVPPNKALGGWSCVTRTDLDTQKGKSVFFVKRQTNYLSRTWRYPFRDIPTFQKKLENIQRLKKLNIPSLRSLYFDQRNDRAVLITKALDIYTPLDKLEPKEFSRQQRQKLIRKLANK